LLKEKRMDEISDELIMKIVNAASIFPGNHIKDIGEGQKKMIREIISTILAAERQKGIKEGAIINGTLDKTEYFARGAIAGFERAMKERMEIAEDCAGEHWVAVKIERRISELKP